MGRYSLIYEKSPPPFVFQYESFPLAIGLTSAMHGTQSYSIQLQVILRYWDTKEIVTDPLSLEVVPLDQNGLVLSRKVQTCQMLCHLGRMSDGRSAYLEVMAHNADYESAISPPICVVREKLTITHEPPEIWFKDEGGREKCMQLKLKLEAASGRQREDRIVPLDIQLYYESGERVSSQRILRLFPDLQPNMVNGSAVISFRIDDVSKNHQGQSFMLLIGPNFTDHPNMFRDIAPVKSAPIAIRSKRNKRKLIAQTNGTHTNLSSQYQPRTQKPLLSNQKSLSINKSFMQSHAEPEEHIHLRSMDALSTHASRGLNENVNSNTNQAKSSLPGEWNVIGFEVYANGTMNCNRPIYRCNHCHRLIDSDRRNAQSLMDPSIHERNCLFLQENEAYPSPIDQNGGKDCEMNGFRSISDTVKHSFRVLEERDLAHVTQSTPEDSSSNPVKRLISSVQTNISPDTLEATQSGHGIKEPIVYQTPKCLEMETQMQWQQNVGPQTSEELVHYILAQMYCNVLNQNIGFPSFDVNQQLVGFYQETHVDCMTQMVFYPLTHVCVTESEKNYLIQLFQQAFHANAPSLHTLSDYEHNLVLLRENALMFHWNLSISSLMMP
uniref:Uncharacterized protein AlNc14C24G2430 n=1 Tax=Albugo laibachii Nc14 TaxID=890382 RepID=F0W6D0_9STRA|nr:conserved hypothetical protein [Albugo laibachii Nc14]|eukprot:CCA16674.1 conserved hypothetical protein [Albugo laibachii Nc14]